MINQLFYNDQFQSLEKSARFADNNILLVIVCQFIFNVKFK